MAASMRCLIHGSAANLTLAFGSDGTLFMAHTAHEPKVNTDGRPRNERPLHVVLSRSTDSGRTFETTHVYAPPDCDRRAP